MTFTDTVLALAGNKITDRFSPEALADWDYAAEQELKQKALEQFLSENNLPCRIDPVTPSPRPRFYRTTGKRRATFRDGRLFLHMGRRGGAEEAVTPSMLEPEEHRAIYEFVHRQLSLPKNKIIALHLNYCILRGSYEAVALIFNLRHLNGEIVGKLKHVAGEISAALPIVKSCFIYLDESASDYYLEAERPERGVAFKKLFGPEFLDIRVNDRKFLYPPTVFSQVNESILPDFIAGINAALDTRSDDQLLDLYCGYGLFSLALSDRVGSVFGADIEGPAIRAAQNNGAYHFGKKHRYSSGNISKEFLESSLPPPRGSHEIILLDPPRKGCHPGVIEKLVARRSRRIVHVFCGTDELARELKIYQANGCRIESLHSFDLFPGSINLETLAVLLPPAREAAAGKHSKENHVTR